MRASTASESRDPVTPFAPWASLSPSEGPSALAAEFDVVLLVRCEDLRQLRDVVLVRLHEIPAVTAAQTFVLLDEPSPRPRS